MNTKEVHDLITNKPGLFDRGDGTRIARIDSKGPGRRFIFCPGYMSDMTGSKAQMILSWGFEHKKAVTLFDYSGCGRSQGDFNDGSIARWRDDCLSIIDDVAEEQIVLIGSSMGGWVSLLAALERKARVCGLILIAPAPDFTEWGLKAKITPEMNRKMIRDGFITFDNPYGTDPYRYTSKMLEESAPLTLLHQPIPFQGPVHILHGQQDAEVPWDISLRLMDKLESEDVTLTLIKNGTHRLSDDDNLNTLVQVLRQFA